MKTQKVVMLFDLGDGQPDNRNGDYVWVGDAHGGVWIRGVTKDYPAGKSRQSTLLAAMDDWDMHRRPGESCTNTVPAREVSQ